MSHLSLFFSKLNKLNILSYSSWVLSSSPFMIFIAFLWTHSNISISFLYCGAQNCNEDVSWDCTNAVLWDNRSFPLLSYTVLHAPQGMTRPFVCHGALLTHIEFAVSQNPHIPFCTPAPCPPILCIYPGSHCSRCRICHVSLLSFIWLVPAQGSSPSRSLLKVINSLSRFCTVGKQCALNSSVQVFDKNIEENKKASKIDSCGIPLISAY